MIYKAFLNRQEITGFPVKGKETSEIWGGNTLLWKKKQGISIKTDVSDRAFTRGQLFYYKLVSTNGIELGILGKLKNGISEIYATCVGGNEVIHELPIPGMTQYRRTRVIGFKDCFYAIQSNYNSSGEEKIIKFLKLSDKGDIIFQYSNSESFPDSSNAIVYGFFVDTYDTFYILARHYNRRDKTYTFKIHKYRNGGRVSSYTVTAQSEDYFEFLHNDTLLQNEFEINGKLYMQSIVTTSTSNTYRIIAPLMEVSPNFLVPVSTERNYLGTDGNRLFFTGIRKNDPYIWSNDSDVYLLKNGEFLLVYSGKNDDGEKWQNGSFETITFIGTDMFVLVNPSLIIKINTKTYTKATLVYDYSPSKITALTAKNSKLYVHKSNGYIDEISF